MVRSHRGLSGILDYSIQMPATKWVTWSRIEKLFNQGWKIDVNDVNQIKFYPWYTASGVFGFRDSAEYFSFFISEVAFYKSKKISDYVGTVFLKEYKEFLTGKIEE